MWTSRTSALFAVVLASCNWAYGLDETTRDADRDGDGVQDSVDNCPGVANPDQLDSNTIDDGGDACAQCPAVIGVDLDADGYDDGCDRCLGPGPIGMDSDGDMLDDGCDPCSAGKSAFADDFNGNGIGDGCEVCFTDQPREDVDQDGLDDACDTCLAGPPHDEDGDGIDDACDNCPLDPNPTQVTSGPSGLGLACSRGAVSALSRALFDPFLVRDNFHWIGVVGTWSIADDRAALTSSLGERTIGARFAGEFRFLVRAQFVTDDSNARIALSLDSASGPAEACSVDRRGRMDFAGRTQQITPSTAPLAIELYHSDANATFAMRCAVTWGSESQELVTDPLAGKLRLAILGQGPFDLLGVDLTNVSPVD